MTLRSRIIAAISMGLFFVLVGTAAATAYWQSTASVGATVKVANLADSCTNVTSMLNASFEEPAQASNLGYANDGTMPGWRAKNAAGQPVRIEIWNGYDNIPAGVGDQFVELNADVPGTIYQSLTTTPGQTLQWSLLHRGRQGVDTMELFIGAVGAGVSQGSFSDGTGQWTRYSGAYVVPAGQTTTELSFKAVTAAGGDSIGNFLDDVSFGSGPCLTATTSVANITLPGSVYRPGDTLEYTTLVKNSGSSLSQNSTFEGVVPAGLNYVPESITVDGVPKTDAAAGDTANFVTATRAVAARLGSGATDSVGGTVAQGTQTATVKFRVTVPVSAMGASFGFTPEVEYVNGLAPTWTRSATSNTVTVAVPNGADLSTVVTVSPSAIGRPGGVSTVTWTWVVTNNGNAASGPTTTVPISIPTNGGITGTTVPVIAANQVGTCSVSSCTTTPAIAVGQSRTFSVSRTVPSTATIGTAYTLTASASSSVPDYFPANNSGSATATVADIQAPSVSVLSAANTTRTQTTLNWTAATDNVGVTGYNVYRAGVLIASTTGALTYTNVGLLPSTTYLYTVKAVDAAGNESAASNSVTVTTFPQSAQKFLIKTTHVNLCFTAAGSSVAENTAVTQDACATGATALTYQRWYAVNAGDGYWSFLPQNSATMAWAILPGANSANDGQKMQLVSYTGATNQQWLYVQDSPQNGSIGHFVNRMTGKCADINGQSQTPGLQVQQWTCNGSVAQSFSLTAVN